MNAPAYSSSFVINQFVMELKQTIIRNDSFVNIYSSSSVCWGVSVWVGCVKVRRDRAS